MSLHLFLKGNVYDYTNINANHNFVLQVSNDCAAYSQINLARQYWYYKDKENSIAVVTNSDFLLKEINTLIMINCLSEEDRLNILESFPEYTSCMFKHKSLNITAFDLELNEECIISEMGFEYKSLDKVIDFQNKVQEAIVWR